jgi:pSer/pThr/pTyr-binding forkhead associated (FHA) protein
MDVVLVMFKDSERRDFPLNGAKAIIGRRQDCDLRIPTRDVSRQHCALLTKGKTLQVKDMGSSNGTYVNGKRVAESPLTAGDQLRVGPVTFIVQIAGEPADIKPSDITLTSTAEPSMAADGDEDTFDLSEDDFDLDDPISALDDADDEEDMP